MKPRTFFSLAATIALGVVIYLTRHDVADAWRQLPKANPWLLLLTIPTQLLGYHASTKSYEKYFDAFGNKVSYRSLYRLTMELNFINHVFPSGGVSGASYISYRLRKWGVSTAKATLAVIARFGLLFFSYQIMLIFAIVALLVRGHAYRATIVITIGLGALFLFGGLFALYIISSRRRITRLSRGIITVVNWVARVLRLKRKQLISQKRVDHTLTELNKDYLALMLDRRKLSQPTLYALLVNITEVLTIYWVYLAFGRVVNIGAVIVAFGVANVAGALVALPGGIGVYESVMTVVMVSAGVPAGVSLSVTVVYRVINMAVFIPVGYYFYHRTLQETSSGSADT